MQTTDASHQLLAQPSYEKLAKRSASDPTHRNPRNPMKSGKREFSEPNLPENPLIPDFRFKLVCVGDGGIGKTSLLSKFICNDFPEAYQPTVFENYSALIERGNKVIELAVWDTAGQEEYDRLRALSYPETDIALLCFSVEDFTTLVNIKEKWLPEIRLYCPNIPYFVIGLKSDLRLPGREPTSPQASSLAKEWGAAGYIECSARTGQEVDFVFEAALKTLLKGRDSPWRKFLSSPKSNPLQGHENTHAASGSQSRKHKHSLGPETGKKPCIIC